MYKYKQSWKIPYANLKWNLNFSKTCEDLKTIVYDRKYLIPGWLIGRMAKVHNGQKLKIFSVNPKMIGHKFGEFVPTKIRGSAYAKRRFLKKRKKERKKRR